KRSRSSRRSCNSLAICLYFSGSLSLQDPSSREKGRGKGGRESPAVSLYVSADYSSDVDDNDLNGIITSMGVRMRW
ncbi:hypothetical protein B1218_15650, partial [Pseudomonas ogarae]